MRFCAWLFLSLQLGLLGFAQAAIPRLSLHPVFERSLPREAQALQVLKRLGAPIVAPPSHVVCARVEFRVRGDLGPRLSQGLFRRPQKASALLRFQDLGAKGLWAEIAVMTGPDSPTPDTRLDFRFTSFAEPEAHDVVELAIRKLRDQEGLFSAGRTFGIEEVLRLPPPRASIQPDAKLGYQKITYFSEDIQRLGPMEAVRYRLKPCGWNPSLPVGPEPGGRAREFRRHLSEDSVPACFELEAQLLEARRLQTPAGEIVPAREWIEKARWTWAEAQAPYQVLADIRVKPGTLPLIECRDFEIDPDAHATLDHRALGSLARARRELGFNP